MLRLEYKRQIIFFLQIISKDANVMVVAAAGKCLARLANGLKKRFQPYAGACIPCIQEKFRERKQNVVIALREAIDAVFLSVRLLFDFFFFVIFYLISYFVKILCYCLKIFLTDNYRSYPGRCPYSSRKKESSS